MLRMILLAFLIALPVAHAQQVPPSDPAFMLKAIAALQAQRNAAQDAAVVADAARFATRRRDREAASPHRGA